MELIIKRQQLELANGYQNFSIKIRIFGAIFCFYAIINIIVIRISQIIWEREKMLKKNVILALVLIPIMLMSLVFVTSRAFAAPNDEACWGQATKVFAKTGEMGEHASQQPTPRLGLRNLARALADAGVIPDDSMQSLGAFVAAELGLSIEACGT